MTQAYRAFQASLCGFTYTIGHLGGEFIFSHDIVRGPSDKSDPSDPSD